MLFSDAARKSRVKFINGKVKKETLALGWLGRACSRVPWRWNSGARIGKERFGAVAVEVPRVGALAPKMVRSLLFCSGKYFSLEGETERPQSQLAREREFDGGREAGGLGFRGEG